MGYGVPVSTAAFSCEVCIIVRTASAFYIRHTELSCSSRERIESLGRYQHWIERTGEGSIDNLIRWTFIEEDVWAVKDSLQVSGTVDTEVFLWRDDQTIGSFYLVILRIDIVLVVDLTEIGRFAWHRLAINLLQEVLSQIPGEVEFIKLRIPIFCLLEDIETFWEIRLYGQRWICHGRIAGNLIGDI